MRYLALIFMALTLMFGAATGYAQSLECEVIDFNDFTHADAITSISLFGGDVTLNVTAVRNDPSGAVNATAYDTGWSGCRRSTLGYGCAEGPHRPRRTSTSARTAPCRASLWPDRSCRRDPGLDRRS